MQPFETLSGLPEALLENLKQLGYHTMTPIQAEVIPVALKGEDLIAQAETGSGKTAAFGIPLIMRIDTASRLPQALVIVPTRELAEQVSEVLRRLARYRHNLKIVTLAGGVPLRGQISSLAQGAHIIVGTPGRLEDHLYRESLQLEHIERVVLDEADRMLALGFYDAVDRIGTRLPRQRQGMLFSATFPDPIRRLSAQMLHQPREITLPAVWSEEKIRQYAYRVRVDTKLEALLAVFHRHTPESVLLFCNTRIETEILTEALQIYGIAADTLHGHLDQRAREEALLMFANTTTRVLVATDVASRGLDIPRIDLVVNYDLPYDRESYIHRIGRTGRAGESGCAVSLVCEDEEAAWKMIAADVAIDSIALPQQETAHTLKGRMVTLCIDGGKKAKLRAGDILGTLCKEIGLRSDQVGKIVIQQHRSYVAVTPDVADTAAAKLRNSRIKKRKFRVWRL